MATTADFKNGMCLDIDGNYFFIVEFLHVKPGKGPAFVRTKLRNVKTGRIIDKTWNSGVKVTEVRIERRPYQYSYKDEMGYHFLHTETWVTSINTKISLGGSYMWGRGDIAQDEVIRRQYTGSYSFSGSIIAKPWSFLEFVYKGRMTRSRMKFAGIRNSLLSQTHTLGLSLFPFKGFEVRTGCDITRKELTRDVSKTMALMDAGVAYKFSSFRVGVDVRNILDTRHYSYSIFSGINQFSYDYALRGRQILLTFSFTR